jgi:hypothetical protein
LSYWDQGRRRFFKKKRETGKTGNRKKRENGKAGKTGKKSGKTGKREIFQIGLISQKKIYSSTIAILYFYFIVEL